MISRKNIYQVETTLLLIFILSACSFTSFLSNQETQTADGVIYFDDFSNPESGWDHSLEGGVKEYYQGTYHVRIEVPNHFSWSLAHQSLGDVRIEVDLAFTGDVDLAEMGIICRLVDSNNFIFFTIRSDGQYAVFKRQDGNEYFIGMTSYQFSPVIKTGVSTNYLEVECVGDRFTLYANDEHLITANDTSFQIGDVGLIVGAFDQTPVNVFFDNFTVIQP
ncbi:MAG: hypothetical protein PVF83_16395 [Anaerolineales bacterium]|jgi:hypothetical protein